MDVKEAVQKSINYVKEVFAAEKIQNIGLEEVEFNEYDNIWEITVGFSRPWDFPQPNSLVARLQQNIGVGDGLAPSPHRQFKIVQVDNQSGKVKSVKIRELKDA